MTEQEKEKTKEGFKELLDDDKFLKGLNALGVALRASHASMEWMVAHFLNEQKVLQDTDAPALSPELTLAVDTLKFLGSINEGIPK